MPEIRLNNVVLPAPFGPMIAKISAVIDREGHAVDGAHAAEIDAQILRGQHGHDDLRANRAARPGTMPARRKIMNTIMIRPSAMCS